MLVYLVQMNHLNIHDAVRKEKVQKDTFNLLREQIKG